MHNDVPQVDDKVTGNGVVHNVLGQAVHMLRHSPACFNHPAHVRVGECGKAYLIPDGLEAVSLLNPNAASRVSGAHTPRISCAMLINTGRGGRNSPRARWQSATIHHLPTVVHVDADLPINRLALLVENTCPQSWIQANIGCAIRRIFTGDDRLVYLRGKGILPTHQMGSIGDVNVPMVSNTVIQPGDIHTIRSGAYARFASRADTGDGVDGKVERIPFWVFYVKAQLGQRDADAFGSVGRILIGDNGHVDSLLAPQVEELIRSAHVGVFSGDPVRAANDMGNPHLVNDAVHGVVLRPVGSNLVGVIYSVPVRTRMRCHAG